MTYLINLINLDTTPRYNDPDFRVLVEHYYSLGQRTKGLLLITHLESHSTWN